MKQNKLLLFKGCNLLIDIKKQLNLYFKQNFCTYNMEPNYKLSENQTSNNQDNQIFTPMKSIKNTTNFNFQIQPQKLIFVQTPHKPEQQIFIQLITEDKNIEEQLQYSSYYNQQTSNEITSELSQQESQLTATIKKAVARYIQPIQEDKKVKQPSEQKKGCNCKKSNCMKKYCQCYKAKQVCRQDCQCIGCNNRDEGIHEQRKNEDELKLIFCNCKKSECTKNYCECHSGGKKCNEKCNCTECKNVYDSKEQKESKFEIYESHKTAKKKKLIIWNE